MTVSLFPARETNHEKILTFKQDDIKILQRIVDCTLELKQYSKAIKILKESIKHKKTYAKFLLFATLLTKKGDLDKAEKNYKKAIKHATKHSFFNSDLSYCFFKYGLFLEEKKKDINAAEGAYSQAFEIYQFNLVALSRYNKINGKDYFLPLVTSAVPKFGYLLGKDDEYEALVFDSITALATVQYRFMFILYPTHNPVPLYIIALETDPVAISLGNYFLCAFTGTKHINYGTWKEKIDIEIFADEALKIVSEAFSIETNTIRRV
ncbi:MAG: tetratricopeptide repeat protein [Candidatus Heimdallarchaeaceae archaeon]